MLKKILLFVVFAALISFGATACKSNISDTKERDTDAKKAADTAVSNNATPDDRTLKVSPNTTVSTFDEDARPVPAKRENLTLADRMEFLRAIGLPGYADLSERFIPTLKDRSANCEICRNAGMLFHEIGDGKYLVEIFVSEGAHTGTYIFALYRETAVNKAVAKTLEFDWFDKENGKITRRINREVVGGPEFSEKNKILTITAYGRGGGCGTQARYQFTNDRAEIIEARDQECTNADIKPADWTLIPLEKYKNLADENFAPMKPEHVAILKAWLAGRDDALRLANYEYDSIKSQNYLREESPERSPFYAVGDFNGNGVEDFAVILDCENAEYDSQTKRQPNALGVFEAASPSRSEKPRPTFFSDTIDSLFIIHPVKKNQLSIGSYPSDDGFYLIPQGDSYQVKPILDDSF